MTKLGNMLIISALIMALLLGIIAIIRGYKGMKMSKNFATTDKEVKIGYWLFDFFTTFYCFNWSYYCCYLLYRDMPSGYRLHRHSNE